MKREKQAKHAKRRHSMKQNSSRNLYDAAGALLAIVLLVAVLAPVIAGGGFDRDKACVDNVYRFVSAIKGYTDDYDGLLPPMPNYPAFTRPLAPYAPDM